MSRKERKNRGRRDDTSRQEKTTMFADTPPHKTDTPNNSPSQGPNKSKKKVHPIEMKALAYGLLGWWCFCMLHCVVGQIVSAGSG